MTLLTIGIPTYNRAKALERLLDRIVPACDLLNIDVLVSDNCSTDTTPAVLEKYKKFKCLRCVRNSSNLGFDGNLLSVISNASGDFLWWLGDDDNIAVEHLANVKNLLQEHPSVNLFFVNYMHNLPRNKHKTSGTTLQCKTLSAQQYADRYLHKATLISTNILNLAAVRNLHINQACVSKGWINLHLLLLFVDQIKEKNGQVIVIKNPVISQGIEEDGGSVKKWERLFVDCFSATLSQTPLKLLSVNRFKKHFYDINIRPGYLNLANITVMDDPVELNRKIIAIFRPNIFAQLSFWLQYLISRVLVYRPR